MKIKHIILSLFLTVAPQAYAHGGYGGSWINPFLGGVIVGNIFSAPRYYEPPPVYYSPPPVYYYPQPYYRPYCRIVPMMNASGFVVNTQICN